MAVKAHVRSFVRDLERAPAWDPRDQASRLEEALSAPSDALTTWSATVDSLRVGHGAVAMHRRHPDRPTLPTLKGVDDFEALVLCAACLRLGRLIDEGYDPSAEAHQHAVREGTRWLTNLLRMEPDFFDELLLEIAARQASETDFAQALHVQAETLASAAADLHRQGQRALGGRRSVSDALRSLVGAGPNLAKGEWVRWLRVVLVTGLLDAKG